VTRFFLILTLFLQFFSVFSQKRFEWTADLKAAYQKTISLRFQEAETAMSVIRQKDPDNLLLLHVENYHDFLKIYLNEDEAEFKKLEKNKDTRLERIEKEGDKKSPYYLYLQADIRLQWALARLKFEQFSTAFFETNKAFKLLTENAKKFPDFMPNKKDLGILHAMSGTIPDNYKWAVEWLSSLTGTIGEGQSELEEVIAYSRKNDFIYEQEIYVYYSYLLLHLGNDSEEAWKVINTAHLKPAENPMACYVMANVAMRTDRNNEAITLLEKRPSGKQFHPFYHLDYMLGLAKLQRLDEDADLYLLRYVNHFKGRNFIKDAYQKLAWHSLIAGNISGYKTYMNLCRSKGYTIIGNDINAADEAKSGLVPSVDLLKSRLLFDGGYFQQAYDILKNKKATDYFSEKNQLEFTYRLGRIMHKLKSYTEALKYYQTTIDKGNKAEWYFACRAALEKGHILEDMGKTSQAKSAYQLCLSMSPNDHRTALHQQAKSGIRRLKG
jgi:hypothetical protein